MPIRIETASHLHGEVIVENAFPDEHGSLLEVVGDLDIPLRPLEPFSSNTRPLSPKRHVRRIGGQRKAFPLPVDQATLNRSIDAAMRAAGWETQPVATGPIPGPNPRLDLKGDFVRNGVFVEVEFGNAASIFRDYFKFQVASRTGTGQVAVLLTATERLARFFDSGVTTLEGAKRTLPFLAVGIQMPIWFVGIEPADFTSIRDRYEEMRQLCEENGVSCHSYETAYGVPLAIDVEPPIADEGSADDS